MRKKHLAGLFGILLLVLAVLPSYGCKGNTETNASGGTGDKVVTDVDITGKFSVGYARESIVPDYEVPIGGYGDTKTRISRGTFDYIYATCVAMTDADGETCLFFAIDIGNLKGRMGDMIRKLASEETGVPIDHIAVNVTHTHSACNMSDEDFNSSRYRSELKYHCRDAAVAAMADRKPATMEIGVTETVGMNYVRRYLMEDGTYAGDGFGTFVNKAIVGHESEADHEIQMIRFKREGGKTVLLTNYQVHATVGSANHKTEGIYYELSPDFIGSYRRKIETEKDCLLAYFLGGAGNINPRSNIAGETATYNQKEYGEMLADFVLNVWDTAFSPAQTGKIKAATTTVTGVINHEDDHLAAVASEIYSYWLIAYDTAGANKMGAPYGIESPHQANSIVNRAGKGKTQNVDFQAITIGDVGFAMAPYEMFDTNASFLKANKAHKMTFVLGYANDYIGYMPAEEAFSHKGYEQAQCLFVQGSAEIFANALAELLEGLK